MTALVASRKHAVMSGDPGDPLDWLLTVTDGEVLRLPDSSGQGEYDPLRNYSSRDRRRLAGAGLVGRDRGMPADVILHAVQGSPVCPRELVDANPDVFVSWYVDTALAGLDHRAAVRAGTVRSEPEPDQLEPFPAWFLAWCERTVHAPKAELLGQLGAAAWCGAPWPALPDAVWVDGLVHKFERRSGVTVGGAS